MISDHFCFSYKIEICYLYPLWLLGNAALGLLILVAATAGESNLHLNKQFTTIFLKSPGFSMYICSSSCKMDMQSTEI